MRKKLLMKSLLVAAALCVGGNAWAAGYTRTLSESLDVAGYKAKAFYNFQNNTPEVLPTGDKGLVYRTGGVWGLHNYDAGTRSATATIPVTATDILVIQEYSSSYVTIINRGTENATLTTSTGYRVFDITTTADDVTFTVPRYGGIVAALVMEVDNTVETADYTINYKCGGETVKTVSGTDVAVGTVISILSSFIEGGKKYITDDGQVSSLTVTSGGSTLDITVSEAALYTCTINLKADDVLLATEEGTVYAGESTTVYYHKAYFKDGKWYFIDRNETAPGYGVTFSAVNGNKTSDVTNFAVYDNAVYFAEVEEMTLSGSFAADGAYPSWRSNGMTKRLSKKSYIYSGTIAPGVYDITLWARNQRSAGEGTETIAIYLRDEDGNMTDMSVSFPGWNRGGYEDAKTATITIPSDGKNYSIAINNNTDYTSNLEMDYVYVAKKNISAEITSAGWATIYTPYALNFAGTGLTAYTASLSGSTVTLTAVDNVPANTGVVLKGAAKTYEIPVIASSETAKGDLLGSTTDVDVSTDDANVYYVLAKNGDADARFAKVSDGSIAAGKAYLKVAKAGAREFFAISGDDVTAIESVKAQQMNGEVYNLNGQRVAAPQKGLYIVNGKKVVLK